MTPEYDAIVVGARCAGSPTAMLLARSGHRVLLVDRATFPSDTLSTHAIHAPGVAALRRWGLLDAVIATGCPPIETYSFDFGFFTITGTPRPWEGSSVGYAPRRFLLDKILLDAAADAGVQVQEHFSVDELLVEDGVVVGVHGHDADGTAAAHRARVVVGADGRQSRVARAVQAEQYLEKPRLQWAYYTYWRDLPVDGFSHRHPPRPGLGCLPDQRRAHPRSSWAGPMPRPPPTRPTSRATTCAPSSWRPSSPPASAPPPGWSRSPGERCPTSCASPTDRAGRWSATPATRRTRSPPKACPTPSVTPSCARLPSTPSLRGSSSFDDAMSAYQLTRDAQVLPIYEFTTQLATLAPPPPEVGQLLAAVAGNPEAMNMFAGVVAGTVSPMEFFAPENIGRVMGAASAVSG